VKALRPVIVIGFLLVIVLVITALQVHYIQRPSITVTARFMLVGALTINIIALLTLMFFVGKNLLRLYTERRRRVLGYRFRTKLMTVFGILILIPSLFLFIVASGLATNYINSIFSPETKRPLHQSIELARMFYDHEREKLLATAQNVSRGGEAPGGGVSVKRYGTPPPEGQEFIRDAFEGHGGTEVVSGERGDIIRAAVPQKVDGSVVAVVVVEELLPRKISQSAESLRSQYEDYLKIESFKEPLRLNYVLSLGFITLMLVFTALWVSLKISGGITVPIQSLAMATEKVAEGNLEVQVDTKTEDEIGMLIASFNQMVRQLREGKISLQNAYEESDKRRLYLENILQNINSGVLFLDSGGRIVTVNEAACSILRSKREDIIHKDYRQFIASFHSVDLASLVRSMEGKAIRGVTREVKVEVGGRMATLRVYVAGIRESDTSRALGILVVFDDLTDIIKALAWQEMARRLAHEIKNPLTPIKLSTERLVRKWQQGDTHFGDVFEKSTKIIISEVESLGRLVDAFSRYGRMPEISKVPTNLGELIDSVVALYKGFSDVEVSTSFAEGTPMVSVDKEQFKRALINIIDNAIKVMNSRGRIALTATADGPMVVIDIADSGPGIRDDEKDKLFLPYFSKTKGGTGLGLAIAHSIITDHGGRISVRDNSPCGSIFSIEIPVG
jgi:two-component system, NtrC family, nitrogen regulation sensor histidine kinase NtrY